MIGAGLEDLGKGLRSQTGTLYGTLAKGTRYLELTEGYITKMFLDKDIRYAVTNSYTWVNSWSHQERCTRRRSFEVCNRYIRPYKTGTGNR